MSVKSSYATIADGSYGEPLLKQPTGMKRSTLFVRKHLVQILTLLTLFTLFACLTIYAFLPGSGVFPQMKKHSHTVNVGISKATMHAGISKCEAIQTKKRGKDSPVLDRTNPRAEPDQLSILLKNAIVWDGQGNILENVDIYIENGTIRKVESNIQVDDDNVKVIDAAGHIVSPGLIDLHNHLGIDSLPRLLATIDANEMTQPLTPFVRALDGFNPTDESIRFVASGGVTTVLVLPGSANMMGGEAFTFKLRTKANLSNKDMLAQAGIDTKKETEWRYMKMACGENPKRIYGGMSKMPMSRLGEGYLFRKEFARARDLKREQDDWCNAADRASKHSLLDKPFPEDIDLESLVALLRGEVLLNIHCYETYDFETMIGHSLDYGFNISVFHHASDAYRIPEILKRAANNITVATNANIWGYTKETIHPNPEGSRLLYENGIPFTFISDHPVLNAQHLIFESAKATHYGLPPQEAFKAVTSVPADAIGLGHRIGTIKPGYDADLVIWDREPLALGATPLQVLVDGVPLFDERPIEPVQAPEPAPPKKKFMGPGKKLEGAKSFVLKNAGYSFIGEKPMKGPVQVVVQDGAVVCSDINCDAAISKDQNIPEYDLQGGYVLPGLIGVGSRLGLTELQYEESTGDGKLPSSKSYDVRDIIKTFDGIKLGTVKLLEAHKGGVFTAITAPMSDSVVIGVSAAFKTAADSLFTEGALISRAVALHLQIGNEFKSTSFPTISSQINFIRQILEENLETNNYYGQAARGEIPVIITAHSKDEITSLIMLKRDYFPKARFVLHGATEAYLVAPHLAKAEIPVVLQPALCMPVSYATMHCLTGAPLTNGTNAHVLHSHGVKIGLGIPDDGLADNLAWDAGWLAAISPSSTDLEGGHISDVQAIQFVSNNLREIYGLSDTLKNEFVVYSGNPFDLNHRIVLVHSDMNGLETLI